YGRNLLRPYAYGVSCQPVPFIDGSFYENLPSPRRLGGGGADLDLAVDDTNREAGQGTLGWLHQYLAVLVERSAVTGAHEQARLGEPEHRAAQVGAEVRVGDELFLVPSLQPGGDLANLPGPGQRRGILERHNHR